MTLLPRSFWKHCAILILFCSCCYCFHSSRCGSTMDGGNTKQTKRVLALTVTYLHSLVSISAWQWLYRHIYSRFRNHWISPGSFFLIIFRWLNCESQSVCISHFYVVHILRSPSYCAIHLLQWDMHDKLGWWLNVGSSRFINSES